MNIDYKKLIWEQAVEILQNDGAEASIMYDYSGRGMYGDTTLAIDTNASGPQVGMAIAMAAHEHLDNWQQVSRGLIPVRQDSMGRGHVYY